MALILADIGKCKVDISNEKKEEEMISKINLWKPVYTINPAIAWALMEIEAAKAVVESIPY